MAAPVARQRRWVLAALVGCGLVLQLLRDLAVADHVGNVLYAAAVYLTVCLVAPRLQPVTVTAAAFGMCVAVELLQLTPLPGALAAAFRPAALLLGSTFAWPDLLGYAVGCLVAWTIDHRLNG